MASPNLSEIVSTTLRSRTGKLADNMGRNNVIYAQLSKKGRIRPVDGGRTIVQELAYANSQTYRRYSGYEVLNISPSDVISAAEFPWRQAAVAISISGLEMLQNSGREAVINLLTSRIENAEMTAENGMAYDMFSDGSQTGQISGLQALVSTTPTSGTVGGIDRSTWSFWQNKKFSAVTDGGGAMTAANVQDYMNRLAVQLIRNADAPDMILADNTSYTYYLQSLQAIQRITSANSANLGFTSLAYNGVGREIPVYLAGGFQGTTTDGNTFGSGGVGAVGGPPSTTMYFINSNYLMYRPHRSRNWTELDPDRFSVNQDAMVKIIAWAGNMTLSNAFMQGVLTT